MPIQSHIKNPQDEPMPNLRREEEIGLRPVGWLFDDGIELPCYPSNFHLGSWIPEAWAPKVFLDKDYPHPRPSPNESICYVPIPMDKRPQDEPEKGF